MSDENLITEFLEESLDSLTALDERIVSLKETTNLVDDVNEIFRPVHSIKGAASFFELTGMMEMAHKLETLLDQIRKEERPITGEIVDTLSQGFFLLRALVERGLGGDMEASEEDISFTKELEEIIESSSENSPEDFIQELIEKVSSQKLTDIAELEKLLQPFVVEATNKTQCAEIVALLTLLQEEMDSESLKNTAKIIESTDALVEKCGNASLEKGVEILKDFLEDYRALSESPVGVDEILGSLLVEKLEEAANHCPVEEPSEPEVKEKPEAKAGGKTAKKSAEKKKEPKAESRSIRIHVDLLEEIMDLMGELVLSRNQLNVHADKIDNSDIQKSSQQISNITSELQERVMRTRLQPVSNVFNPLPGVVRDISRKLNKDVELVIEGKDTELDRTVLEGIKDPITHILRNSLDHGLETPEERVELNKAGKARLTIKAFHEGGMVIIEISDNGKGVNLEVVRKKALEKGLYSEEELNLMSSKQIASIIFAAGFSTAEKVSQVSGRGVGMDVVRSNIENLGGVVDLDSTPGEGTVLQLKIPLSLAIIPVLVVKSGGDHYALPQANIEEMIRLNSDKINQIDSAGGAETYQLRGKIIPLIHLNKILGREKANTQMGVEIIILKSGKNSYGLIVESLLDIEEIVVKPLDDFFKGNIFSGATIMGDGSVALIIDVVGLSSVAGIRLHSSHEEKAQETALTLEKKSEEGQVLLFKTSEQRFHGVYLDSVSRLDKVMSSKIESMGGKHFLQYRGGVLPLIPSWKVSGEELEEMPEKLDVIIFERDSKEVGLLVISIEDVVQATTKPDKSLTPEPQFLGGCILMSRVVVLFNLDFIAGLAFADFGKTPERVLIWESSEKERQKKAEDLSRQGYDVVQASTKKEASEAVELKAVDVVITDSSVNAGDAEEIASQLRKKYGKSSEIPFVAVGKGDISDSLYKKKLEPDQLMDGLAELLASSKNSEKPHE